MWRKAIHPLPITASRFPLRGRLGRFLLLSGFLSLMTALPPRALADQGPSFADFLMSSLRKVQSVDFCGEITPLDNPEVRERFEKEFLLTMGEPAQVLLWLKRSKRYFSVIEPMLRSAGLPEDLKYLAIAESALKPHAGSPKGAVGFWQFIPSTGRRYGLTIDGRKDERKNIFRATEAAIRYFKDLYGQLGSWTLAAAAYNMGENGLQAEMREQETTNYYLLYLPLETQAYLFRIVTVKLICAHPDQYGFNLGPGDYYPPFSFDRVRIDLKREMSVRLIAQAAGTHFKVIKDLNPDIRGHYLDPGVHDILLPKGASAGFQARFSGLMGRPVSGGSSQIYIVQKGDTLTSIATRFGVPVASLLLWNRLNPQDPIHPGDRLTILKGN